MMLLSGNGMALRAYINMRKNGASALLAEYRLLKNAQLAKEAARLERRAARNAAAATAAAGAASGGTGADAVDSEGDSDSDDSDNDL